MSLTMQELSNVPRPSVKFERLLIGYISKCKDRLSISIVASISQPYGLSLALLPRARPKSKSTALFKLSGSTQPFNLSFF